MARTLKYLSKDDVLRAIKSTSSNRGAARYLHVSYNHYKKYAVLYKDDETGKTLFEGHLNQSGTGIPKFLRNSKKDPALMDILEGRVPHYHFKPTKIKQRILEEGLLLEECSECGYNKRRAIDFKIPLVLFHKDRCNTNFRLDNLTMLCYNCSFLLAADPITDKQVAKLEDYKEVNGVQDVDWELDEYHIEHLKSLGLVDDYKPGSEYISKL
jgi:hypothetical protein